MIEIFVNTYIRQGTEYTILPDYEIEIGSFQRNKFKGKVLQNDKTRRFLHHKVRINIWKCI